MTLIKTYHSGFVTSVSTTVPGGGFCKPPPDGAKKRVLIFLVTTMTTTFGLKIKKSIIIIRILVETSNTFNGFTGFAKPLKWHVNSLLHLINYPQIHTCTVLQGC